MTHLDAWFERFEPNTDSMKKRFFKALTAEHQKIIETKNPWCITFDCLHAQYRHELAPEPIVSEPFYVKCELTNRPGLDSVTSPEAVMLERALVFNGLLTSACRTEARPDPAMPIMEFDSAKALLNGETVEVDEYFRNARWPERVDSIDVTVFWTENGETTLWHLPSDLGLHRSAAPRDSHPVLTKTSTITQELLQKMILSGHPAIDREDGELTEDRRAAELAADMVFHEADGQLSALERLVTESVLPCLPTALESKPPILVRLSPGRVPAVLAVVDNGAGKALELPQREDMKSVRRRHNRLRYEATEFEGIESLLEGQTVEPGSRLDAALRNKRAGTKLWDEIATIASVDGILIELTPGERHECGRTLCKNATHAQVWMNRQDSKQTTVTILDAEDVGTVMRRTMTVLVKALTSTWEESEKAGRLVPADACRALAVLKNEYSAGPHGTPSPATITS